MGLLKNIRDYDADVPVKINFGDIEIKLIDYYPQGFAFRSIHNVEYLLGDDILTKRTYNLFSYLSAARMAFNEVYVSIKVLINNPQNFLANEESRKVRYESLSKDIEKKREIIYEYMYILDVIAGIINRIRDKHYFYITLSRLKNILKKDSEIQRLLRIALWNPLLREMKKGGVPITAFLGSFSTDEIHQESKIKDWEKFKILIENKLVVPCSYKESTAPPEIQKDAEEWKEFLNKRFNAQYSGAYKLAKSTREYFGKIESILLEDYSS